jgi:hypothetical protein
LLLALSITPGVVRADPPAPAANDPQLTDSQSPELLAEMRRQEKLHPAAQALLEAAVKLPRTSGYAGVAYEGDGVTLYYKGSLPAAMASAVADARRIGPVTVKMAAFSRAELHRAQAQLAAADKLGHSNIQAIGTLDDGSGLHVERMPPATAEKMRAKLASKGLTSKDADTLVAGLNLGVPVKMTTATAPINPLSRESDFSPWSGGAEFETWRDLEKRSDWCTTGFTVAKNSRTYMLTAAHCMTAPDVAYNGHFDGDAYFAEIGPVYQEDWEHDVLLIDAPGEAWIYDGGVNTTIRKPVHSWGYRTVNELLCHSGSRSGTICGLKTQGGEYTIKGVDSDGDLTYMNDLGLVEQIDHLAAGQDGDSGGPVFSLDGDGVRAKGTVTAGGNAPYYLYFADLDEVVGGPLAATPLTQ